MIVYDLLSRLGSPTPQPTPHAPGPWPPRGPAPRARSSMLFLLVLVASTYDDSTCVERRDARVRATTARRRDSPTWQTGTWHVPLPRARDHGDGTLRTGVLVSVLTET